MDHDLKPTRRHAALALGAALLTACATPGSNTNDMPAGITQLSATT